MVPSANTLIHRVIRAAVDEATEVYTSRSKSGRHGGKVSDHTIPPPHHTGHPSGHETEGTFTRMEHAGEEILHKVADKSHIPFWGVLLILLVIVLVILVAFYFCLAKYWRKFTESDKGARFKGLDLKSVNLIGQLGKEKVIDFCSKNTALELQA